MKTVSSFLVLGLCVLLALPGRAEEAPGLTKATTHVPPRQVECTVPILPVSDLARSFVFYTETLGFKLDWGDAKKDAICSVSRDKRSIILMKREKSAEPVWVWIGADVALFETYRAKGVKVVQEPKNYTWAYEMKFADPDGNILWLGSEPRKDLPFEDTKK